MPAQPQVPGDITQVFQMVLWLHRQTDTLDFSLCFVLEENQYQVAGSSPSLVFLSTLVPAQPRV